MSISISRSASPVHLGAASRPPLSPERQAFRDLAKSLKAGDIDGARQAYESMMKNAADGVKWNSDSAFADLGKALKAGDMSAAREAFTSMVKGRTGGPVVLPTPPVASLSTPGGVNLVA